MSKRKRPAHELAGQRVFATGALDEGYLIPDSGLINARDADRQLVRPPFNVPKKISLADVAVRLEEHICKRSSRCVSSAAPAAPTATFAAIPSPPTAPALKRKPAEPVSFITTDRDTDIAITTKAGLVTRSHELGGVVTQLHPKRITLDGVSGYTEECNDCGVDNTCGAWVSSLGMDLSSITLVGCFAKGNTITHPYGRCFRYYCDSGCMRRGMPMWDANVGCCKEAYNEDNFLESMRELAKGVGCKCDCCIRMTRCLACGSVTPKDNAMLCAQDVHESHDATGFYCGDVCAAKGAKWQGVAPIALASRRVNWTLS
mgnify:CR=1 FL=1|tara:strand:- start:158 stop:1105 length:948 start_codon:yes stop_codon:yes gene_type:complete